MALLRADHCDKRRARGADITWSLGVDNPARLAFWRVRAAGSSNSSSAPWAADMIEHHFRALRDRPLHFEHRSAEPERILD